MFWLLLVATIGAVAALDNGVALLPYMGYNTWYDYGCNISEAGVLKVLGIIAQLRGYGYEYLNLDDCWALKERYSNGTVRVDPVAFPRGMKYLADKIHQAGFKFGIYTCRGNLTCAGRAGSLGYEAQDAQTYAEWGVDFVKEDSCYASSNQSVAFSQYARMRDALNQTGRPMVFNLCGWNPWYAPVGASLGNSWRIGDDGGNWDKVRENIDNMASLHWWTNPGAFNDPDYVLGSDPRTYGFLTPTQSRAQFSLWSVLAAPLILGMKLSNLSSWDLETITNREVIAINQDSLVTQGQRVAGGSLMGSSPSSFNVWSRVLQNRAVALCFFNNAPIAQNISCDSTCFAASGLAPTTVVAVRDVWLHKDIGFAQGFLVSEVPAFSASLFRLTIQYM